MGVSIDRLSDLPDPILMHILSFLSTEEAVGTCVLSKRWKKLGSSVPDLTFHYGQFIAKRNTQHEPDGYYETKFVQFIQGVLNNRDETLPLEKFYIRFFPDEEYSSPAVDNCMLHVMKFRPRVLRAVFGNVTIQTHTEDSIFTCATLQDLHWHNWHSGRHLPDSVSLPSLRKLHLYGKEVDDAFFSKLFIGCPILVELSLCCCTLKTSRISANQLRVLVFHLCFGMNKLKVFATNLFHLKISLVPNKHDQISVENTTYFPNTVSLNLFGDEYELLCGLSNVACLDITMDCPQEDLKKEAYHGFAFNHLKSLTLRTQLVPKTFDLIAFFLKHSPNLKKLTLHHKRSNYRHPFYSMKPFQVARIINEKLSQEEPNGVSFHRKYLETIEIMNYSDDEYVTLLVKYLNDHVKSLGEVRVL